MNTLLSKPYCLLCGKERLRPHFWPPLHHLGRSHEFFLCLDCHTVSLAPPPDLEQQTAMYSSPEEPFEEGLALPLHRSVQLDFLRDSQRFSPGLRLLDYACCGGFYLHEARRLGFKPTGVEFSPDYAERVSSAIEVEVITPDVLDAGGRLFDVVHLGHVLEHVSDPASLLRRLSRASHPKTLWLIDGPLENNLCLSRLVVDLGSRLRSRAHQEIEPQHLTCTTGKGQRAFFEALGFEPLRFDIREQPWPLPDRIRTGAVAEVAMWGLARVSMAISTIIPQAGNLFHLTARWPSPAEGSSSA